MDDATPPPPDLQLLDPAPALRPRRSWEKILGLLLLGSLVSAGLWSWWTTSQHLAAYQAGTQAANTQDWDSALAAFTQAADYSDARAQAQKAVGAIATRNAAYATATTAYTQQDWLTFLSALTQVRAVAPAYRDTPALTQAVPAAIARTALSGTVALRTTAQPPGWYTYTTEGWHWLVGSDPASHIQAHCPNGDWVLDVAQPVSVTRTMARLAPDGTLRQTLDFPYLGADLYNCDGRQVWAMQFLNSAKTNVYPLGVFTGTYQVLNEAHSHVPVLPGPSWYLHALEPDGQHVLIQDITTAQGALPTVTLYRAAPDGSDLRFLGALPGTIRFPVQISPDGQYALELLGSSGGTGATAVSPDDLDQMVLVDLSGRSPARVLDSRRHDPTGHAIPVVVGFFVDPATNPRNLILLDQTDTTWQIEQIDPAKPMLRHPVPLPRPLVFSYTGVRTAEGGLFLAGVPTFPQSASVSTTLAYLDASQQLHTSTLPPAAQAQIPWTARGDRLVYYEWPGRYRTGDQVPAGIYSLPVNDLGAETLQLTALYTGTRQIREDGPAVYPWYTGPEVFVYCTPSGALHARRYDGSNDIEIEQGVQGFAWGYRGFGLTFLP